MHALDYINYCDRWADRPWYSAEGPPNIGEVYSEPIPAADEDTDDA